MTGYLGVPLITSNSPSPRLFSRTSLQNFMIPSHSPLEAGIPPRLSDNFTSSTRVNAFLNSVNCDCVRASSAGGKRYEMATGVGHFWLSVGYDSSGPETDTTDAREFDEMIATGDPFRVSTLGPEGVLVFDNVGTLTASLGSAVCCCNRRSFQW